MSAAEKLDIEVDYQAALEAERQALAALDHALAARDRSRYQSTRDAYRRAFQARLRIGRQRDQAVVAYEDQRRLDRARAAMDTDPEEAERQRFVEELGS